MHPDLGSDLGTDEFRVLIAENLKVLRAKQGLTQAQMAEAAHVENQTYQRYEYADINIPMSKAIRICRALGCGHGCCRWISPPAKTHQSQQRQRPDDCEPALNAPGAPQGLLSGHRGHRGSPSAKDSSQHRGATPQAAGTLPGEDRTKEAR